MNTTKTFKLLLIISLMISCESDDAPVSQESLLPPITTTGENTFGCLVDGKYFRPRDGRITVNSDNKGLRVVRTETNNLEFHVYDRKSDKGGSLFIHLENFYVQGEGTYHLDEATGLRGIDGPNHNYIYGRFYNKNTGFFETYVSKTNTGSVTILNFSLLTNIENIKSGTFSAELINRNDQLDTLKIESGRFDLDSFSLDTKSWD